MERSLTHPLFFPDQSFQLGGWRFILLDSQEAGCVHGSLSASSLNELDRELTHHSHQPTIVALHHPPFQMHSDWLDTSILQNPEELFAVLDRHSQIKLVLFGHVHQEVERQRRDLTYLGTPSTCIQFEPKSCEFSIDSQKPGFRLLNLYPNGNWDTQVKRISYSHQLDLAAIGY
jgi:Icc protein